LPRVPKADPAEAAEEGFYRPASDTPPEPRRRSVLPTSPAADDSDDDREPGSDGAFLRAKKRPPVRKSPLKNKTARRLVYGTAALLIIAIIGLTALAIREYGTHNLRFRIETSDNIETGALKNISRSQILEVFGADIGRNIFFIPLEQRRKQIEEVPWVKSATVMRFLPDRLRVQVTERTPIAFAQLGTRVKVVDENGVLMDVPHDGRSYSFPVITGFAPSDPLSTRAPRMKIYQQLIRELDADNSRYSADLSEVDLSDPEDVRITVGDANGTVLIHLGDTEFQRRYRLYIEHINTWRQQRQVLSVDLRYEGQVIVNREGQPTH
jgi:cell division protein FtsQ